MSKTQITPSRITVAVDRARELAAAGETLDRIVILTGLNRHVAYLAIRADQINQQAEEDGRTECHESILRSRSQRERRREKPTLAEIRQKARNT